VIARSLDIAAVLAAAGLGLAVALWTGRREHWLWRPEHLFLLLLGIVVLRLWLAPRPVPAWRPRRVIAVGIAAYAVLFSFVTVTRHLTFATHALDLGYYVQLTWNLARGAGPRVSLPEMHAWGDHLSPIMYLFVPAFWLAPGASQKGGTSRYMIGERWSPHACISGRLTRGPAPRVRFHVSCT